MHQTIITLSTGEEIHTKAPEQQILEHITNNQGMMNKAFVVIGGIHIATAHIVKIESIEQVDEFENPDQVEQAEESEYSDPEEQANADVSPNQVELVEQELLEAMQTRDIFAMDMLMHDDFVFINHEGSYVTKEMDLETHRTLAVRYTKVSSTDQQIKPTKDGAVTISRIHLEGQAGDEKINGDFIYTRVWQLIGEQYQVIAGHCSML
ncbi:nuclear transport factor 2 family protein [Terribacillus saccharophilus]|uniref:DUF4440 domain-containing protein n=1 Tax=Terribacillus saccharophilus TaxID=361277 RepID=A0A268AFG6_9BACI|nr:nuclear transport factor 2 family protein [Terribacillus saccharophilus]PAD22866.1 hypothetical protein CHH64_03935 [Terribacillus saccharophilus]